MKPFTVVLADDHAGIRQGLHQLIDRHADLKVVAEAQHGVEALQQARAHRPDVLLLDINMPLMGGYDVMEHLNAQEQPVPVLVMSSNTDWSNILTMLALGVAGYLSKDEAPQEIMTRLVQVAAGHRFVLSTAIQQQLDLHFTATAVQPVALTPAETDVLRLVGQGYRSRDIAQQLQLEQATLQALEDRLYAVLGVKTRRALVQQAWALGVVHTGRAASA